MTPFFSFRRKSAVAAVLCAAGVCGILAPLLVASPASAEDACFLPGRKPSIEILQNAPPPRRGRVSAYPFYPASAFTSMNLDSIIETEAQVPLYYWQWGNHGPRRVRKPNLGPNISQGSPSQLDFSSIQTADACTLAQTATVLGLDRQAQDFAREGGVTMTVDPPNRATVDVCVVWNRKLPPHAAGVLLDYEVQDGRTPAQSRAFLLRYARLVHGAGKKAILYTNPLDAPSQRYTGIDASNANELANTFDLTSIFLWSRNRQNNIEASFRSQMGILGKVDPKRLMLVFELAGTTLQDAAQARALAKEAGIEVVNFWRNNARQGGACSAPVNRKIACLAFGECGR